MSVFQKLIIKQLALISAAVGATFHYIFSPSFHLDIQKNGNSAQIERHERNFPRIRRISHYNEECLIKKGYIIELITYTYYNSVFVYKKDLIIEQLMADCKECDVHTVIDYEYKPFYSTRTQDYSKRLEWSACHVRRELK